MRPRHLSAATLCALAALSLAACGGSGSGKAGGSVTVLEANGGVNGLDPGFWYYQADYTDLGQTTQRWLYGWTASGTTPVPDLATAMPAVSDGGRVLTIHIRTGVHYSRPLASRTVTAADVKYAMERCFSLGVGNGYAPIYYGQIEGAPAEPTKGVPDISGIQAPDSTTLVIRTHAPVGVLADADALALPCTVPVPQSYAARYDAGAHSTYGEHQVFTGPYMIAGAGNGTVPRSSFQPGGLLVLERNPSWQRSTDPIRKANFNRIVFKGGNNVSLASQQILAGQSLMSGDYPGPPPAILKEALASRRSQLAISPAGATQFISLNTTIKPLDNVDVRRAISAAIDRNALRLTVGGAAMGQIATHFIPPGIPGFEEAGGAAGPGYDFASDQHANLPLAASYLRKAGYTSGRYEGPALLAVAQSEAPGKETAEAVQAQLARIGIRLTLREVPLTTMMTKFCTVPKAMVAICPNLTWGKDFLDAQSMIDPVFNGAHIGPQGNPDTSQANNPRFNEAIMRGEGLIGSAARAKAWGTLDRETSGEAYVVPWLWPNQVSFHSANVIGVPWAFNGGAWDLTASSLK
jgi:peptide/nickel transport system substrate-binding protein